MLWEIEKNSFTKKPRPVGFEPMILNLLLLNSCAFTTKAIRTHIFIFILLNFNYTDYMCRHQCRRIPRSLQR